MDKRYEKIYAESTDWQLPFETDSLLNHSRKELIQLAKNLSNGKFKKDSEQRDKLMQLLVKQLSSLETST